MIPRLASPSVCVIDDEQPDYQPILDALLKLGIACVHVRGDSGSPLPPQPFEGLRIVFTDLYLSGSLGKTSAAHTANVFKTVVSAHTAPVLVVIWSKHTDERDGDPGLPPEDQPTAADLFKSAVLEAEPLFRERLIFTEMAKPKPKLGRPDDTSAWITTLQVDIEKKLLEFPACDLLWSWESLVREAGISISEELTSLALQPSPSETGVGSEAPSLDDKLKLVFRQLAKEQGGPDCSESSAPRHLAAVLAQSLADEMEHTEGLDELARHGAWLCEQKELPKTVPFASQLNGVLLTSTAASSGRPFVPGTVYRLSDLSKFEAVFGVPAGELTFSAYQKLEKDNPWTHEEWKSHVTHVVVEISPACDFHQGTRRQALLVAGLLVPAAGRKNAKRGDAFESLPTFNLRWPVDGKAKADVFLTFCCRYKLTLNHTKEPEWLLPWFRLRELPTASLRNWHASHSARVGYVSLR